MHTSTLVTLRAELAAAEKRRALRPPRVARKRTVADAVATWGLQLGLGGRNGGGRGGSDLPQIQSSPELHDAELEKLESQVRGAQSWRGLFSGGLSWRGLLSGGLSWRGLFSGGLSWRGPPPAVLPWGWIDHAASSVLSLSTRTTSQGPLRVLPTPRTTTSHPPLVFHPPFLPTFSPKTTTLHRSHTLRRAPRSRMRARSSCTPSRSGRAAATPPMATVALRAHSLAATPPAPTVVSLPMHCAATPTGRAST
eukprot:353561-Chlamydomonas_euryale.AAC.9